MGGLTLVGWLPGFQTHTSSVAKWKYATSLGENVKPPRLRDGSAGRASTLHRIPWRLPYN